MVGTLIDTLHELLAGLEKPSAAVWEKGGAHILAEPGPGCKPLTEEWSVVVVFVYSLQAIEDSGVNLPILSSLKLDSALGAS